MFVEHDVSIYVQIKFSNATSYFIKKVALLHLDFDLEVLVIAVVSWYHVKLFNVT